MTLRKIWSYAKYPVFLALGVALLLLAAQGQDFNSTKDALLSADYGWVAFSLSLAVLSHVFRALRWIQLIEPLGTKPGKLNTTFAVLISYAANLVFPRLGEISKCAVINRYEGVPITKLIGTMIAERLIDLVCLLILVVAVVIFQFDFFYSFFADTVLDPLGAKIAENQLYLYILIGLGLTGLLAFWRLRPRLRRTVFYQKLKALIKGMLEGTKTFRKVKNPLLFIGYTFGIWFLYFAMTYACMMAMPQTASLGWVAGVAVLVFGSFGMVAPVSGGLGAFHAIVKICLVGLYLVDGDDAFNFATLLHGSQTVMLILGGVLSIVLLPVVNRKKQLAAKQDS